MKFTYGIVCGPNTEFNDIHRVVRNIYAQMGEESEIIGIGDEKFRNLFEGFSYSRFIDFTNPEKQGWITRKKNILTQEAKGDIVVLLHDYYLCPSNFEKSLRYAEGDLFQCPIVTKEGFRHSDWIVDPRRMDDLLDKYPHFEKELMKIAPDENGARYVCGLPYDIKDLTHLQYVSGGLIIGKRDFLLTYPQNEDMVWGDAEDLWWSFVIPKKNYTMIRNCLPWITDRPNKWKVREIPYWIVHYLREL